MDAPVPTACWGDMPIAAALVTSWDLLGISVAVVVFALALVVIALVSRRKAPPAGGATINRRELVERGVLGLLAAALVGIATSAVDYVVTAVGHPGRRYSVGTPEAIRAHQRARRTPYYEPVGGFYVVTYPTGDLADAKRLYHGEVLEGMETGFVALDQACTHLGCRVPWCRSSQWFECPCHGSRYNAVGEQQRGPAPRGLDRYPISVVDGQLVVDTRRRLLGAPPGTDSTGQSPAGPHCY